MGSPVAYDVWADRHRPEGTLSRVLRWVFRVDALHGKVALLGAWGVLTAWLLPHLLRLAEETVTPPPTVES